MGYGFRLPGQVDARVEAIRVFANQLPIEHPYRTAPANDRLWPSYADLWTVVSRQIYGLRSDAVSVELDAIISILQADVKTGAVARLNALSSADGPLRDWLKFLHHFGRTNEFTALMVSLWKLRAKPRADFALQLMQVEDHTGTAKSSTPAAASAGRASVGSGGRHNDSAWDE